MNLKSVVGIYILFTATVPSFADHMDLYEQFLQPGEEHILMLRELHWAPELKDPGRFVSLTAKETALKATSTGYNGRREFEKVFRARMAILERINALVPSLEVNLFSVSSLSSLSGNLVGFLLPANWFRLRTSKKYYSAEKLAYQNFLLDEYLSTQLVYYELHRLLRAYMLMKNFKLWLDRFLSRYEDDLSRNVHRISEGDWKKQWDSRRQLKLFRAEFFADLFDMRKEFDESMESLSLSLGMEGQSLYLIPINLGKRARIRHFPKKKQIIQRSYLLKSLDYYAAYLHNKKRAGFLSFLTGSRDNLSLSITSGLDIYANYQTDLSSIRDIEAVKQKSADNLTRITGVLTNRVAILQDELATFHGSGRRYEKVFNNHLKIYDKTGIIDAQALRRTIKWAVKIGIRKEQVLHDLIKAKAEMRRLEIGEEFSFIEDLPELHFNQRKKIRKKRKSPSVH